MLHWLVGVLIAKEDNRIIAAARQDMRDKVTRFCIFSHLSPSPPFPPISDRALALNILLAL